MPVDLDHLKKQLESKYKIDCYIFLEDLEQAPSSTLYSTLAPWIKSEYSDDYRFVLFNFKLLDNDILTHVSSILSYLDISPYFIQVITDQESTTAYFQNLVEPIQVLKFDAHYRPGTSNNVIPLFNNDRKMCAHAWVGLHVDPGGTTRLCCEYTDTIKDDQGTEFNIRQNSITEILDSQYLKSVRDIFRKNMLPDGCNRCAIAEKQQGISKRMLTPYKLENVYGYINWESDRVDDHLSFIGGHLGNLCNLKCRICSPVYSSSIAIEQLNQLPKDSRKTHPVYSMLSENSWANTSDAFWAQIKTLVPKVRNFEILGGEPLLIKENIEFMEWLIEQGHSQDVIFEFTTNGTVYPKVFDSIEKFKRLTLTISVDNIGPMFEVERHGITWQEFEKNFDKFLMCRNKNESVKIGISISVNIQNVLYLPELVQWLESKGIDHYFYNWVDTPSWLSIRSLTPAAKNLVLQKLQNCNLSSEHRDRLQYVVNRIKLSQTSDGMEFCKEVAILDNLRKQNFAETHKEIAIAMGL